MTRRLLSSGVRFLFLASGLILFGALSAAQPATSRDGEGNETITVIGDSIAAGYGVGKEHSFPARLQSRIDKLGLPYSVVNAGVSGDTTAGGLRRIQWILKRPADILIIELGGNDGLRGILTEETERNLNGIIDRARERNPKIRIIIAGMQMPQNMGLEYTEAFRAIFPRVAKEKKVSLVPFLLESVGGVAEMNQLDLIHTNKQGHEIVAENVWKVLRSLIDHKE